MGAKWIPAKAIQGFNEGRLANEVQIESKNAPRDEGRCWWRVKDLNLRRQSRGIYSPLPLAARATRQVVFTAGQAYPYAILK